MSNLIMMIIFNLRGLIMTREEAKRRAELYSALAEGKTIQYKSDHDEWVDLKMDLMCGIAESYKYRIKSEDTYRPFKTQEECWNEMLKHQPFGWVTDKCKYVHIVCVRQGNIEYSPDTDDNVLYSCIMTFSDVLEQGYTFVDGTPFGIKEE